MVVFETRFASDLARLVQSYGFLPLLKNQIPGFSVEEYTTPELWFVDDADGSWAWKEPVFRITGCANGKFFLYSKDRLGNPYGWGLAQYATPEKYFGSNFVRHVYDREPSESRERLYKYFRDLLPQASEKLLEMMIG